VGRVGMLLGHGTARGRIPLPLWHGWLVHGDGAWAPEHEEHDRSDPEACGRRHSLPLPLDETHDSRDVPSGTKPTHHGVTYPTASSV